MVRKHNGWIITATGGYFTLKRFIAHKGAKGEITHWSFRLKDCKRFCDMRDNGETIDNLYLNPLYI